MADPLESMKIVDKTNEAPKEKPKASKRELSLVPQEPKVTMKEDPKADPTTEEAPYKPKEYRVMETRTLNWGGYVTTLSQGGIVSESGYGKEGIQRMIHQGFKLQEITE